VLGRILVLTETPWSVIRRGTPFSVSFFYTGPFSTIAEKAILLILYVFLRLVRFLLHLMPGRESDLSRTASCVTVA
jgi:hypothetical protein